MPEAVIVSAARSPIGRAFKGSLTDLRPDDLTATIVRAALDKIPELDPHDIDDLYLGCGLPGGESGFNMGRIVSVLLGYDHLPGATITRYCSSSVQTTRMAFHAIKAGEGDVFISAGVETVSRFAKGNSDSLPGHHEPGVRRRQGPHRRARRRAASTGTTRARTASVPDAYIAMGQTAENVARLRGLSRAGARRVRRAQPEPRREGDRRRLLGPRDHPGHDARRHRGQRRRRPPRRRHPRGGQRAQAGVPPRRRGHGRQLLRAQRRRRRGGDHVRHQGQGARPHPAGPGRLHRRDRPVPRDHGPGPGRGDQAGADAGEHDASTTSTWSRSTRRSRRRWCRRTRTSASTWTG